MLEGIVFKVLYYLFCSLSILVLSFTLGAFGFLIGNWLCFFLILLKKPVVKPVGRLSVDLQITLALGVVVAVSLLISRLGVALLKPLLLVIIEFTIIKTGFQSVLLEISHWPNEYVLSILFYYVSSIVFSLIIPAWFLQTNKFLNWALFTTKKLRKKEPAAATFLQMAAWAFIAVSILFVQFGLVGDFRYGIGSYKAYFLLTTYPALIFLFCSWIIAAHYTERMRIEPWEGYQKPLGE